MINEILVINGLDIFSTFIIKLLFGAEWLVNAMTLHPDSSELNGIPAYGFFYFIAIKVKLPICHVAKVKRKSPCIAKAVSLDLNQ